MADWFVSLSRLVDDPDSTEVFEFISYREAVRLAHRLAEDQTLQVELLDYEGLVVRSIGRDKFDGTPGFSCVPLRAGLYRWHEASESMREVSR